MAGRRGGTGAIFRGLCPSLFCRHGSFSSVHPPYGLPHSPLNAPGGFTRDGAYSFNPLLYLRRANPYFSADLRLAAMPSTPDFLAYLIEPDFLHSFHVRTIGGLLYSAQA